jgi:hypothetical protein
MSEAVKGFGWGDKIDPTAEARPLLTAGAALFKVTDMKRDRKEFGKFGVQNIAVITLVARSLETPEEGEVDVDELTVQLALVSQLKWKIVQFFTSIGQRKSGDEGEFTPDWSKVKGSEGGCTIEHRPYKKRDGTQATIADVAKFLAPDEEVPPKAKSDDLTFT